MLKHPATDKDVWVAVHTKKDAWRLGNRILREAGVETVHYPIVFETEPNDVVSAYVPGLLCMRPPILMRRPSVRFVGC